jgi:peptidoglycan/xylan/chitin deacetylase (PgdA/CDA1 family)
MKVPTGPLERLAKHGLHSAGYYRHRLAQVEFPGVAVLCYHGIRGDGTEDLPFRDLHVDRSAFEGHCRILRECCSPISATQLLAALNGASLPPRPALVTFDDGYRSVLDLGLPILEEHEIPAAVFVCVEPIVRHEHFWYDSVYRARGEEAVAAARRIGTAEWRTLVDASATPAQASDTHRPMTVDELRRLAASPLIEIGGHTMTHLTLARASVEEQRDEIEKCRDNVTSLVGAIPAGFAYPYGLRPDDYSADTVTLVAAAGFKYGFSTHQQFASRDCSPFEIPRFVMVDGIDEVELAHRLTHSWHATRPV